MKECKISFHMNEDGNAKTEVMGMPMDVLFCLVSLTNDICSNLHVSISAFSMFLPTLAEANRAALTNSTKIDIGSIEKQLAALYRDGDPEKGDGKEHER